MTCAPTGPTGAGAACTWNPTGNVPAGNYVFQVKYGASDLLTDGTKVPCPGVGGSSPSCNYTFTPTTNSVAGPSVSFLFRKR